MPAGGFNAAPFNGTALNDATATATTSPAAVTPRRIIATVTLQAGRVDPSATVAEDN